MKYVFLILFLIPAASGYSGLFSILDEKYISDISELPYKQLPQTCGYQKNGIIFGCIEIAGFRNMSRIGDTYYVNDDPVKLVIIQADATAELQHGVMDDIKKTISITQLNQTITVKLDVVLIWHDLSCAKNGCTKIPHYSTATFYASEISPLIYPSLKDGYTNITEYNNSINPHVAIGLNLPGNVSKVTYRYGSDVLTHYFRQGHVEQTKKGVYFLNLSVVDYWTGNTESLQHFSEWVMIPNSSRPDYSKLSIEISNQYETMIVNNYSFERITYIASNTFSNPLLMFTGMILTFIVMSIIAIRRA